MAIHFIEKYNITRQTPFLGLIYVRKVSNEGRASTGPARL